MAMWIEPGDRLENRVLTILEGVRHHQDILESNRESISDLIACVSSLKNLIVLLDERVKSLEESNKLKTIDIKELYRKFADMRESNEDW